MESQPATWCLVGVVVVSLVLGAVLGGCATTVIWRSSRNERVTQQIENLKALQAIAKDIQQQLGAEPAARIDRGTVETRGLTADAGHALKDFFNGFASFAKSLSGLNVSAQMYLFSVLFVFLGAIAAAVGVFATR
jgi:hypothetical protein